MIKISIFNPNFNSRLKWICTKISAFDQYLDKNLIFIQRQFQCVPTISILCQNSIFDQNFYFQPTCRQTFLFSRNFLRFFFIFEKIFYFRPKFRFSTKFSILDQLLTLPSSAHFQKYVSLVPAVTSPSSNADSFILSVFSTKKQNGRRK